MRLGQSMQAFPVPEQLLDNYVFWLDTMPDLVREQQGEQGGFRGIVEQVLALEDENDLERLMLELFAEYGVSLFGMLEKELNADR